jgi:hypothetical protein
MGRLPEMHAFPAGTIFCALRHKKLPEGRKIAAMTKATLWLSISEFSTERRAKLAFPIEVCDAFCDFRLRRFRLWRLPSATVSSVATSVCDGFVCGDFRLRRFFEIRLLEEEEL